MKRMIKPEEKRRIELALRDAGLSRSHAKAALSVFGRFLLERDAKPGRERFFYKYLTMFRKIQT